MVSRLVNGLVLVDLYVVFLRRWRPRRRDGGLLLHLAGVLLLDYYAAEGIGAALPRRLYFEVTRLEVHEKFGSAISSLAASTRRQGAATPAGWGASAELQRR